LAEAGFIENGNITTEYRWAYNQFERLPKLADDLVGLQPRVILAANSLGPALAAKRATSTIPIAFLFAGDPVKYGLVASRNRPGGNVTGIAQISTELAGKRLNLLRELVPQAKSVAFLTGTPNYISYWEPINLMLDAGRALGLQILILECRDHRDFEQAFARMLEHRIDALILGTFTFGHRDKIVDLATRHSIPTMYPWRWAVVNGGLISYGPETGTIYGQLATQYVAPILKGAKPADLPVQRSNKFELIINLETAKALGLTIPRTLLAAATELID
jgi:putative ABC transport system substrate-binding protein